MKKWNSFLNTDLQLWPYEENEKCTDSPRFIWFSYMICYFKPYLIYADLLQQICIIVMLCACSPYGCGGFAFYTFIT